jgi:hypothetical protein
VEISTQELPNLTPLECQNNQIIYDGTIKEIQLGPWYQAGFSTRERNTDKLRFQERGLFWQTKNM